MDEKFVGERIAQLRTAKGPSARDMSLSLGQNESYINRIENGKSLPSLQALFWICDYFQITPKQFFDEGDKYPTYLESLVEDMRKLDAASLSLVSDLVKKLTEKK